MNSILSKEIIKEWDLQGLPISEQEEMVERIGLILYQAILVKSLDILSDKEQDELDLLLDKDETTPQIVMAFLNSKIPTFDKMVNEEKINLKRDLFMQV